MSTQGCSDKIRAGSDSDQPRIHIKTMGRNGLAGLFCKSRFWLVAIAPSSDFAWAQVESVSLGILKRKWRILGSSSAEGDRPGAAFFLLNIASNLQQAVEHFGAFRAASGELGICLLVCLLEAMKFVGDVQRG